MVLEAYDVTGYLADRRVLSSQPVSLTHTQGELFANHMEILHNGDVLKFTNGVSGTLFLAPAE